MHSQSKNCITGLKTAQRGSAQNSYIPSYCVTTGSFVYFPPENAEKRLGKGGGFPLSAVGGSWVRVPGRDGRWPADQPSSFLLSFMRRCCCCDRWLGSRCAHVRRRGASHSVVRCSIIHAINDAQCSLSSHLGPVQLVSSDIFVPCCPSAETVADREKWPTTICARAPSSCSGVDPAGLKAGSTSVVS